MKDSLVQGNVRVVSGGHILGRVKDMAVIYVSLTKPAIMALLLLTTLAAMFLAEGVFPPPPLVLATMLGGALAAGGASAINSYLDRDIDVLMDRTRRRPIPAGKVKPYHALAFGFILCLLSLLVFISYVNILSGVLAIAGVGHYTLVYTAWLKRRTPHNIVVGGGAGGFAPLVGWAAATNEVGIPGFVLFAVIFFWTPPHFWALALRTRADYERAKLPMMPVVGGVDKTKAQILMYSLLLTGVTLLPFISRMMGLMYLGAAVALGSCFVGLAWLLRKEPSERWASPLFWYSNAYLALLFSAMVLNRIVI